MNTERTRNPGFPGLAAALVRCLARSDPRKRRTTAAAKLIAISLLITHHSSFMISAHAAPPTTDPTMNSILGFAKPPTAKQPPATEPAIAATPLKNQDEEDEARPGTITMSDGKTIKGKIATTAEKPLRVWVEEQKDYTDVPLSMIDKA